jgi:hypothetical protein
MFNQISDFHLRDSPYSSIHHCSSPVVPTATLFTTRCRSSPVVPTASTASLLRLLVPDAPATFSLSAAIRPQQQSPFIAENGRELDLFVHPQQQSPFVADRSQRIRCLLRPLADAHSSPSLLPHLGEPYLSPFHRR